MKSDSCYLLDYSIQVIPWVVETILSAQQKHLPDLSHIQIILPHHHLQRPLIQEFHRQQSKTLLGPHVTTLQNYILQSVALQSSLLSSQVRELEIVSAIKQNSHLFGDLNPWAIAPELISLFDELNLQESPHQPNQEDLIQQLRNHIANEESILSPLLKETELIFLMWQAWREQLKQNYQTDISSAYRYGLEHFEELDTSAYFYILSDGHFYHSEQQWIRNRLSNKQATLVLQGKNNNYAPSDLHNSQLVTAEYFNTLLLHELNISPTVIKTESTYEKCLNTIFAREVTENLANRARQFASETSDNPLHNRITITRFSSPEWEAHGVDQTLRRLKAQGLKRIAIVVEDRRLARRIRALLERWKLYPYDSVGWVLSTTSAASSIERWLQCIEEDFSYNALLDLLKQPFLHTDADRDEFLNAVYRFEQDIIIHENVAANLQRYRFHLELRSKRLGLEKFTAQTKQHILTLFDKLESAAAPLLDYLSGLHRLHDYLTALRQSLDLVGLHKGLSTDDAGMQLLELLDSLQEVTGNNYTKISWLEFRSWLGKNFESSYFQSQQPNQEVQLLSLEQSSIMNFEAVIVAGADAETFPGKVLSSPFFNNLTRIKLGLNSRHYLQHLRFFYFRQLLSSAPKIAFTYSHEVGGVPRLASPWLRLIQSFTRLAFADKYDLSDDFFLNANNIEQNEIRIGTNDKDIGLSHMPKPNIGNHHRPKTLSARAYQELVSCPYRYFAQYILKLSPSDQIRLALQKSDYGERVHRCLQAFHQGYKQFAPFQLALTQDHRQQAIEYLIQISSKIFAKDIEDNFEHRSWLEQWKSTIPHYIDWQINHTKRWQVLKSELKLRKSLNERLDIEGRIDRLDGDSKQQRFILDYKTGTLPSVKNIENGEDVQLGFYGMLADQVDDGAYLEIKPTGIQQRSAKKLALAELVKLHSQRLQQLTEQIDHGAALPAWGDEDVCVHCRWIHLCQKRAWNN